MNISVSRSIVASLFILAMASPVIAGEMRLALPGQVGSGAEISSAAFGDGPPTGPRHARRNHGGEAQKSVEPSHADLNGATRESADKAYRKQYGF